MLLFREGHARRWARAVAAEWPSDDGEVVYGRVEETGTSPALWKRLDATGMALGITGLVLFNFAFGQAPVVSWTTPYTYFILIIGALFILAFIWYERSASEHPLIPISAMNTQTTFVLACTATRWAPFSI
jgi:hypothetical protein